jgi:ubiquinone/menaquinone biosynthesis C-methylase UbiE
MPAQRPDIDPDWYAESFGALYPVVYAHRSVEAAAPEAAFARRITGLRAGEHALDLACGTGRHLVHLTDTGARLTGLDFSSALLTVARGHLGQGAGNGAQLVRGDMRRLPFPGTFDVVFNFFTSFGYFQSDEENRGVAREIARVLKPGGRFFIDYVNPRHVATTLTPETVREADGLHIRERRWLDTAAERVNKTVRVERDGAEVARLEESVRLYEADAFEALLASAGLVVDALYGDYAGEPVAAERPRLIATGSVDRAHG